MLNKIRNSNEIDWNNIVKKEVRGLYNEDLGEVKDIQDNYIIVERGAINKERFYFQKNKSKVMMATS